MEKRFCCAVCVDLLMHKQEDGQLKVLLMRRKNTGTNDGEYELPGGHLDPNEDLFDAMVRETEEELLIKIKREKLKIVHLMHHYTGTRLNFVFAIDGSKLKPKIGEPEKCDKLEWFNIDNLPNNLSSKMKTMISNIKQQVFYDKM